MAEAAREKRGAGAVCAAVEGQAPAAGAVRSPTGLYRTAVYRRVPRDVRLRLDAALLDRPEGTAALQAIAEKFELQKRYGLTLPALRTYARRLEAFCRPALASAILAAMLGGLPAAFRRSLQHGSEVLLLSRLAATLNRADDDALTVADLVKLGSMLAALAGRRSTRAGAGRRGGTKAGVPDASQLARTVRELYGLNLPVAPPPGNGTP